MSDWKDQLIKRSEEVVDSGWGKVSLTVTANGRRKAIEYSFTEIFEEENGQTGKEKA